ncbi:chromosome segregation protein SMC [Candidatus Woesearchaeota archaeon]|nr:chromosome segregation protein SMC [Candidatus Woesearchaeota archaeon]MBW3005902.1 chromosome segregation protein SMC [Candidatus Woesearchaeota archaeon]
MTEAIATEKNNITKINKLVMDGFKSFGKRTELLFEPGFNVVLGPNGSGKSNILDALCFVLGKSSSKSLRAEKSANLIYNGGKAKKPANTAEVSIVFDNKERIFPVEEDSVKVSRIVRPDGVSRYKINNKNRTRQEIVDMLALAKIYPDGYNIILQGDIVKLVEMSPVERRQIVEEIAGISVYEEKKQKALNELQKVEDKLNEAEIILKERETYLKELKKDRDQALKYKRLSDDIKKNKASYLKRKIDKKEDEKTKLEEKSSKNKERLEKLNSQIDSLRKEIAERKDKIKQISDEIEEKGEVEQVKLQKEVEKLRVDLATKKTRVSSCNNEVARIDQRKEQLKKNLEELDGKIDELKGQKKELTDKKKFFTNELSILDKKISDFKKKHKLGEDSGFENKIEDLDKQADDIQKSIQNLREKQQDFIRGKDKCEFQLQIIDQQIEKVLELEKEHKNEIDLLKKKKSQFKKLTLELNELLNADSAHANKLADARKEAFKLNEKIEKLQIKNASIKESISANIAVKKVLENKNKLGQIYGTIAELGTADKKFSMALEIAAAKRIQSIVVEDDKTAAKCIKFLKDGKLGVASFLPLNKIKPASKNAELSKLAKQKGVHGFAIDLIEFDTRFKNAFSHVFGNTLVVDNIETARKIGIGKARMVSLDGDLAESSGAMIGGFRHKKEGSFRQKDLSGDISDLKKELKKAQKFVEDLESERSENEKKIYATRELKANLEGDIIKTEKSLHLDSSDLQANEAYKKELQETMEKLNKDIAKVEDDIAEETEKLTGLKVEKQKLRVEMNELRNPRLLAELNTFEQKKKEFSEEVIKIDADLKNMSNQEKDIVGRDKENTDKILKELEKEAGTFKAEIKSLNKEIKDQSAELKVKETEQNKFFSQFKSLFEQRTKLSDEITEQENKILGLQEGSRKEELTINTFSIEEAKVKAELAGMNAEFAQYEGVELDMEKSVEKLKKEISDFEKMMANIGNVNLRALEIYETVEKEYTVLIDKKNSLVGEKDDVMKMMEEIETSKKGLFLDALGVVNKNFVDIFTALSTKGEAFLELENPESPFDEGLRIKVRLTGKKFMDIRSLSGGEKTLTALAFLFAIQEHEPASFYILDEVDAALDKANSQKLADLIRDYCNKAQYVVISHNDNIISEADALYGVSMQTDAGLSNVVSLDISKAKKIATKA